jgi:hypothetical protein
MTPAQEHEFLKGLSFAIGLSGSVKPEIQAIAAFRWIQESGWKLKREIDHGSHQG